MAIYLVKTPSGERLIEAKTKAGAINVAMKTECFASALTAPQLATYLRHNQDVIIETSDLDDGEF